jgi:hypothetical protein
MQSLQATDLASENSLTEADGAWLLRVTVSEQALRLGDEAGRFAIKGELLNGSW